jgi:hypothetical protein
MLDNTSLMIESTNPGAHQAESPDSQTAVRRPAYPIHRPLIASPGAQRGLVAPLSTANALLKRTVAGTGGGPHPGHPPPMLSLEECLDQRQVCLRAGTLGEIRQANIVRSLVDRQRPPMPYVR